MKHIVKKTVEQYYLDKLTQPSAGLTRDLIEKVSLSKKFRLEDTQAILFSSNNISIRAFHYKHLDKYHLIPLANPVIVYFNEAYKSNLQIVKFRNLIFESVPDNKFMNESAIKMFYDYFGSVCSFSQSLLNSIEAFVNWKIPEDYIHKAKKKFYNKEKIQRYIPIEEKIKVIMDNIFNKSFAEEYSAKFENIIELKRLRDSIVHTKQINAYAEYQRIYEVSFKLNYDEILNDTKDLINYYESDLIQECDCGFED